MKLALGAAGTVTFPGSQLRWESHMCAEYSAAHASCSDIFNHGSVFCYTSRWSHQFFMSF